MENQSLKIELKQGEKEFYLDVGEILFFETDTSIAIKVIDVFY